MTVSMWWPLLCHLRVGGAYTILLLGSMFQVPWKKEVGKLSERQMNEWILLDIFLNLSDDVFDLTD